MSIDFSKVTGWSDAKGVITQVADSAGRVIWSAIKEVGTIILRPSADISVEHELIPASSTSAYLLINEEVSDGSSTYIRSHGDSDGGFKTSKFKLAVSGQITNKPFVITSVNIIGEAYSSSSSASMKFKNEFQLEINGVKTSIVEVTSAKGLFDLTLTDAISLLNEAVGINQTIPDVKLVVTSYTFNDAGSAKDSYKHAGVTQVYVVLGYEA